MANPLASPPSEDLVYAPAVQILAGDLYPRKLEIVREYVQNASDAIDMFQRIAEHVGDDTAPQIKLSVKGKSLLIWDNGIGMDAVEMQKLRRIAYSEKKEDEHAGHKGIGRLAGIGVAAKLVITSTCYGDAQCHRFEFRAKDFQVELDANRKKGITESATEVINRHTSIVPVEVDRTDHYTMVELREIDDRYPELLDPLHLREYIAEMGPVGFAPDFSYGARISAKLKEHVPDFSPKTILLSTASGDRSQIFKSYRDAMKVAEPEFIEVEDPEDSSRLLAFCWYTVRGKEMFGRVRPAGNKFAVNGASPEEKQRLAGLVYKLFGFSIGDRNLPLRTLWAKDYTRPLWFSGEIHIVDKRIKPTTDRSHFVDNTARNHFFEVAREKVAKKLNTRAQTISDLRTAFDVALDVEKLCQTISDRLKNGSIDRTELRAVKGELRRASEKLSARKTKDPEVEDFVKRMAREVRALDKRLDEAKTKKAESDEIADLGRELHLTTQARAVYRVVMETTERHFAKDKATYFELADEIKQALKKRL